MNAYEGIIKKKEFVDELVRHQKMDLFVKGKYWADGKGCAVGCSLHSISVVKEIELDYHMHANYEKYLGIPEWLARVEDQIFEGLPKKRSMKWPVEFAKAIHTGADLEKIKGPFLVFVLESALTKFDHKKNPKVKAAVLGAIKLWSRKDIGSAKWKIAASASASATSAATYADYADYAVTYTAYATYAACAACAAPQKNCVEFADYLLKLLKGCK